MEKLLFKANNYNFYAQINGTIMSKDLVKRLPAKSKVQHHEGKIYFYLNDQVACKLINVKDSKPGDLIYDMQNRTLCILFDDKAGSDPELKDPGSAAIVIGHVLSSIDEVAQIELGEDVEILLEDAPVQYDTKILSQAEVDAVLKGLLNG